MPSTTAAEPSTTPAPPTTPPAPTTTARRPATRATSRVATPPHPTVPGVVAGGLAIGDSVLEDVQLYAPRTLNARGIAINAAVGRAWVTGESILWSLRRSGRLPSVIVVALGTNGPIGPADFDAMMRAAAGASRVVFMTVTGPYAANNSVIRNGVARYQAALGDWAGLSGPHPAWFAPDHVHIGSAGATALGNLLASLA
jgi:hypothetical protein